MIAAVLCGGKGTRLRSVIGPHQKCAVEVGGRPWIHRVLDFLQAGGIKQAILLTGYKAEEMEEAQRTWEPVTTASTEAVMRVDCLHSKPSGPAAAVELAFRRTKAKHLLVVNGDTLVEGFPLQNFLAAATRKPQRNWIVRSHSAIDPGSSADAGLSLVLPGQQILAEYHATVPFLDIGSPEGLAVARGRFGIAVAS